jgi:hypothetical protein
MWYRLERVSSGIQHAVQNMDREQWMVISVVAVVLGAILLRGFGSRTDY